MEWSWPDFLNHGLQALAVPLVIAIMAGLFPYRKPVHIPPLSPSQILALKPQVQKLNLLSLVLFLTITPLSVYLVYDFLVTVYHLLPKPSDGFTAAFPFEDQFWLMPATSIGFVGGFPVMDWSLRKIMGHEQYDLVNHAVSLQYGFDGEAAMRGMTRFFVGIGLLAGLLCYNTYAGVQSETMVVNKFLELRERRYALKQITRLTYIDHQHLYWNGKVEKTPYYEIAFRDGFVWDTHEFLRSIPAAADEPLLAYLSKQTAVRIDSIQRISRIDKN